MGRAVPRLSGALPPRFADTEWSPPSRADEQTALAEAAPDEIIAALSPLVVPTRRERIDRVAAGRLAGVALVLEDLHDPHNGGAALRSCEAVGLCGARPGRPPPRPRYDRPSPWRAPDRGDHRRLYPLEN